ncbi:MAG: hypothetical protein ACT4PS_05915 [Betaproteobacteria bacterium]
MIKPSTLLLAGLAMLASGAADATGRKTLAGAPLAQLPPVSPAQRPVTRSNAPVAVVNTVAPGQTGYVHFFLLRDANDETETQIGIELEDGSMVWSFPHLGVVTTAYVKSGTLYANGRQYEVEHLYGVRPFPDERSMRILRAELAGRIAPYIDDQVPYCYLREPGGPFCLSCLDFVVRVLFPGHFPLSPAVPRDFERTSATAHTTDDLLLYLLGLQGLPNHGARIRRIDRLALPDGLREDALHLVEAMAHDSAGLTADAGRSQNTARKGRRSAQPSGPVMQQRQARRRRS